MALKKIETYLGFSVRARKIVYGAENAEAQRKGVYLLVCDKKLGASSFKLMQKAQERLGCPLLIAKENLLSELIHRPAVKAVAIKEKNLASAILSAADGEPQFKLYSGGTN